MNIDIDLKIIRYQAISLHEFIKAKYPDFKLSNAYEALAIVYGFENWNTMSGIMKKLEEDKK